MQRRRLVSTLVLVCTFGLSLLGVAGTAEAASKFAWIAPPGLVPDRGVYVMNSDGTGETLITTYVQPTYPVDLSWSPDGTMLAVFLRDDTGPLLEGENPRFQIIRISDGSVVANHPITDAPIVAQYLAFEWSPEITPSVAAISPLGQLVIVFLLGAVTALYLNRRRQVAGA